MKKFLFIVLLTALVGVTAFVILTSHRDNSYISDYQRLTAIINTNGQGDKKESNLSVVTTLPAPVKKYLATALQGEIKPVSFVRLKHEGSFKTAPQNGWMTIKGEQYFTVNPPGFLWQGKTTLFTARDSFIDSTASLKVYLAGAVNIADDQGGRLNDAALLRWLTEHVLFPAAFLPDDHLSWQAIDQTTARLVYRYGERELKATVYFNEHNEISSIVAMRYMQGRGMQKWLGRCSDYRPYNNVKIPWTIEAAWDLKEGPFTYARFNITTIEYNRPGRY